jgi:heme/copper-type cytochrome/quinol oxidase subunit 3
VRRYGAALLNVVSVPLVLTTQAVYWIGVATYAAVRAAGGPTAWLEQLFPPAVLLLGTFCLLVGNFVLLLAYVGSVYQQGRFELVRYALLLPAYFVIASIGAWRGVLQLWRRPHFWDKTEHGLADELPAASATGWRPEVPHHGEPSPTMDSAG